MKVSLADAERVADLIIKSDAISNVINTTHNRPTLELHLEYRSVISKEINAINQRCIKS